VPGSAARARPLPQGAELAGGGADRLELPLYSLQLGRLELQLALELGHLVRVRVRVRVVVRVRVRVRVRG